MKDPAYSKASAALDALLKYQVDAAKSEHESATAYARIGNPTGLWGVSLTQGTAVNRRFWPGRRHDSQKTPPNGTPSTA